MPTQIKVLGDGDSEEREPAHKLIPEDLDGGPQTVLEAPGGPQDQTAPGGQHVTLVPTIALVPKVVPGPGPPVGEMPFPPGNAANQDSASTIELKISFPSLSGLYKLLRRLMASIADTFRQWRTSRRAWIAACALLTVAVAAGGYQLWSTHRAGQLGADIGGLAQAPAAAAKRGVSSPSYSTILPAGETIQELGGWGRVSPPGKSPVYAYIDNLQNVQINVSEQPLPSNLQSDTADRMEQLAQSFNANEKIAAGNTTVYIGTSADGSQSVIFTKDNLLVLIKSMATISSSQWATYVSSLQ